MTEVADPGLRPAVVDRGRGPELDCLAAEAALEIRVDGVALAVLLRTPGEDLDLVAGFLVSEGFIEDPRDLKGLAHCEVPGDRDRVVQVTLAEGVPTPQAVRAVVMSAACGLCGTAHLDLLARRLPPRTPAPPLDSATLDRFVAELSAGQRRFQATGGLHGAALFDPAGRLIQVAEDVGRHNAVDKVLGARLRADAWPLPGHHLVVSSRAGYELVQKALVAGVASLSAVGAASSLAHEVAMAHGLALHSFVRPGRHNRHVAGDDQSVSR